MVLGLGGLVTGLEARGIVMTEGSASAVLAVAGLIVFSFQARPVRFGLGIAATFVIGSLCFGQSTDVLHVERNFFGVIRISRSPAPAAHVMSHGTTNHGMQRLDPVERLHATGYYHRSGPLGQVFAKLGDPAQAREIGIIGLGTGGITAYAQAGQRVVYYEIDPAVERLARDPRYFTYLRDCKAQTDVVLGDARLTISAEDDSHFDILILDAFTSDAIPIHLITREAIRMYLEKLTSQGVLVLHISNRYLDLEPILGNIAADLGAVCRIQKDGDVSNQEWAEGKFPSTWAVIARGPQRLGQLADDPKWKPVPKSPDYPLWTDDFSNILAVLRWW
jgi:spermidine synthase